MRKGGEGNRSILSLLSCRSWRCFWHGGRNWKEKRWWSISRPQAYFLELLLEGNTAVASKKPSQRERERDEVRRWRGGVMRWWWEIRGRNGGKSGERGDNKWQEGRMRKKSKEKGDVKIEKRESRECEKEKRWEKKTLLPLRPRGRQTHLGIYEISIYKVCIYVGISTYCC